VNARQIENEARRAGLFLGIGLIVVGGLLVAGGFYMAGAPMLLVGVPGLIARQLCTGGSS
jgi:hypothetical protein